MMLKVLFLDDFSSRGKCKFTKYREKIPESNIFWYASHSKTCFLLK